MPPGAAPIRRLSAREDEIANLVATGKSNRAIADALSLSERTVEHHVASIFNKLAVRSRGEVIAAVFSAAHADSHLGPENLPSNNLPLQISSFVGREDEIEAIGALLRRHRLVTLVGAGGVGKTRCALEVGAKLLEGLEQGVWLAQLAPISDPALVSSVITQALGVQQAPNRPPLDILLSYLKRRRLLLVLDNCEHVLAEARTVSAAILNVCPEVRILATSREGLNIAGEQRHRTVSLSVPPPRQAFFARDAVNYSATTLFADRARAADTRFTLTDENAPSIAEICRRLDGIPLAIELAAARVKMLSPQQIAQKMGERFRVLTDGVGTALPRHRTMRALIDWSYDLLSGDERTLFRRLSIFPGAFTLGSASAVCSDDAGDEMAVLADLSSLVDKSLVHTEPISGVTRYGLLESFRQYAREKLAERSEQTAIEHRHASVFLELAERLEQKWDIVSDYEWLPQAEQDLENWRAALEWALAEQRDVALGQRLAAALRPVWQHFALMEGRRWVWAAEAQVTDLTPLAVVAKLKYAEAFIAELLGEYEIALTAGELALATYREVGDPRGTVATLRVVGSSLLVLGRMGEGESLLQEALVAARMFGTRQIVGWILASLAFARSLEDDVAGARVCYAEARLIFVALGSERAAAAVALDHAETEYRAGDAESAVRLARGALATFRILNQTHDVINTLTCMSSYLIELRRYAEAVACARESLHLAYEHGWSAAVAFSVQNLAAVAILQERSPTADTTRVARLLGFVDARIAELKVAWQYTERREHDRVLAVLSDAVETADLVNLMTAGAALTLDRAVEEALNI